MIGRTIIGRTMIGRTMIGRIILGRIILGRTIIGRHHDWPYHDWPYHSWPYRAVLPGNRCTERSRAEPTIFRREPSPHTVCSHPWDRPSRQRTSLPKTLCSAAFAQRWLRKAPEILREMQYKVIVFPPFRCPLPARDLATLPGSLECCNSVAAIQQAHRCNLDSDIHWLRGGGNCRPGALEPQQRSAKAANNQLENKGTVVAVANLRSGRRL